MFTDIVGSTAARDSLVAHHGEIEGDRLFREQVLDVHNERIRSILPQHHGFEVKTNGDSFMVSFETATAALTCATNIQQSFAMNPVFITDVRPLSVRIGVHTGQATLIRTPAGWDYDGQAVNIGARIEGLLRGGGQILCSSVTSNLAGRLPGVRYHVCGNYALKGVSESVEIVDVLWRENQRPSPPQPRALNVPYPWLTPFVGRSDKLRELCEALRRQKLITVHGIGGVGKTRLAVEAILQVSDLPSDVVFVALDTLRRGTKEELLAALRDGLGLSEVDAPDFTTLRHHLVGRDLLLILDNFETVMAAMDEMLPLATMPCVRTLITSQQTLGITGEAVIDLDPMNVHGTLEELESYHLFARLVRLRDARWRPDTESAMREVLAFTDGLPYLIEIIAASAARRALSSIAAELRAQLSAVAARPGASRLPRHQSLQACLEWAMNHLSKKEADVFVRLGIFEVSFTEDAAVSICETTPEILCSLIDASLLRLDRETLRYSMLPTTAAFVRERLPSDGGVLAHAHAAWYVDGLTAADHDLRGLGGGRQSRARKWITAELRNIYHAIDWAATNHLEIFQYADLALHHYLRQHSLHSEAVRLTSILLASLDRRGSPELWCKAQLALGNAYAELPTGVKHENVESAIRSYEAALPLLRHIPGTRRDWAMTNNNLGVCYLGLQTRSRKRQVRTAIQYFRAALTVFTEAAYPADWAMVTHNLGAALIATTEPKRRERAFECFEAALRVRTESDYPFEWAMTQLSLGHMYRDRDDEPQASFVRAIAHYEAALRVYTEATFPSDWALVQHDIGSAYVAFADGKDDDLVTALHHYAAADRIWTESDFPECFARNQSAKGDAYVARVSDDRVQHLQTAVNCYESALRVYTRAAFPVDFASTHEDLGDVFATLAKMSQSECLPLAIQHYATALEVWSESEHSDEWAVTSYKLGAALVELPAAERQANLPRAIQLFRATIRVRNRQTEPTTWAAAQHHLGCAYFELSTGARQLNLRQSIAHLTAALEVQNEHENGEVWAQTQFNLGHSLSDPENDGGPKLERAIQCYEAALRVFTEATHREQWVQTLTCCGMAYFDLQTGARETNLARAITCFQEALHGCDGLEHTIARAGLYERLGLALAEQNHHGEQLESALAAYEAAARAWEEEGDYATAAEVRSHADEVRKCFDVQES
jgi:class 3 adenylate cyclase/tetratricopeptide (TPR) repeat protein